MQKEQSETFRRKLPLGVDYFRKYTALHQTLIREINNRATLAHSHIHTHRYTRNNYAPKNIEYV